MIAFENETQPKCESWQDEYLKLYPEIQRKLRCIFSKLDGASREEAVGEATAHSLLSYRRLHRRGRAQFATAATLAYYSARQIKQGRPAVGRMNRNEPLARYAQLIGNFGTEPGQWINDLIDSRRTPILDQVATKMDLSAWLTTLSSRLRKFVAEFAAGCTTSEVARKFGLIAGRVSQIRRELDSSWSDFQPVVSG